MWQPLAFYAFPTHMHVLLLVLDAGQRAGEFPDHVLQLGVAHLLLSGSAWGALWGLTHVDGEHDQLGRHAAALVVEAHGVGTLGGGHEGVLAGGLLLAFVHHMVLGAADLDVHVQEAAVNHLEGDACKGVIVLSVKYPAQDHISISPHTELGAAFDVLEEALLVVGVHADDEGVAGAAQDQQAAHKEQHLDERPFHRYSGYFWLFLITSKRAAAT